MTDTHALQALRDKVATGEASTMRFEDAGFDGWAELAYHGSLDAAKKLHEALLPGWAWEIREDGEAFMWPPNDHPRAKLATPEVFAHNAIPARAWLLAILDALIEGAGE